MKREELTPIELECNMGPDVNGVVQREPWKAYDIDEVDALLAKKDKEIRRLKRALWLARAERADDRARIFYFSDLETILDIDGFSYDSKKKKGCKKMPARTWRIIWLKVERKCRAKAEEYR